MTIYLTEELRKELKMFAAMNDVDISEVVEEAVRKHLSGSTAKITPDRRWQDIKLDEETLTVRAKNALYAARVSTLGELAMLSKNELLKKKNCGRKTIDELEQLLARHGARLRANHVKRCALGHRMAGETCAVCRRVSRGLT